MSRRSHAVALIPYIAVLVGLHYLRSAWAAILFYNVGVLAFLLHRRFDWKSLGSGWHTRDGLLLVMFAAASGPLLFLLQGVLVPEGANLDALLHQVGLSGNRWPLFVIYYIIATPLLEEAFWRGALATFSPWPDFSDLLFAGYHVLVLIVFTSFSISVLSWCGLVVMAWIWRQQRMRHGGLAVPVISHFAADLSIMVAASFLQ